MAQFKLDGTPISDNEIVYAHPRNVITLMGHWAYEEDEITEEDVLRAHLEDVRVWYCEYAEFEANNNQCIGGCDSKGGQCVYCLDIETKMSLLGRTWRTEFS